MDVRLVLEKSGAAVRTLHLKGEETVIGRRRDCDLRIQSSQISRRHCLLRFRDGYLTVEDLDSVNGTFLNGERVEGKQVVRPGDHLEVGPARFVVEYQMTKEALDRLEPATVEPVEEGEELEALPLAEEERTDAFVFEDLDEKLENLPLADEDTELITNPPEEKADEDEAIPFVDDFDAGDGWKMPEANDLRDILSQMDDKKARRSRKEE
jgi:pSer/pThr/pTyr-binding forkhead associated (FHA) protein